MAKAKEKLWTMPAWMEPYREAISETGGNSVEELVNNRHTTAAENLVLACLCIAVKAQVRLLIQLHKSGALPQEPAP